MTETDNLPISDESNSVESRIEKADVDPQSAPLDKEINVQATFIKPIPSLPEEQMDTDASNLSSSTELLQILEAIQSLSAEFQNLQRGFDSKIKYDTSKERIINTLHKELQSYRDGLHFKILWPLFLDLIAMHDDMESLLKHAREEKPPNESGTKLLRSMETFLDTIEDILYRNGVEIYREEGDSFVAQRQRSIRSVKTDIQEKDRLVAERIRKGFAYEEKVLRPEIVTTFKYGEESKEQE